MADPATGPLTLGLDLGTSAVKALLLDAAGEVLAVGTGPFPTVTREPGQAEQDPREWLAAAATAVAALDVTLGGAVPRWQGRVAAIGLAGQLPTLVCLRGDQPLGPAITWKDSRADAWASRAINGAERRLLYERTGMPIDGRYLGPMFHCHWSERVRDVDGVLSAKDFLAFALTGRRVTDPSTAAGYACFDLATGAFSAELCDRWGIPLPLLPAVLPSSDAAGTLTAAGAALLGLPRGTPVAVGAADSVASAYAMANLVVGTVCVTMGSSTIILDAIRERRLDPSIRYLLTPHVEAGWYGREMDLLATGTGYAWLSALFGWADGVLDAEALRSPPGAHGVSFTPYLGGGEQGALWNPALRASIRGLGLAHSAKDIARAFLEGVNFEIRRCLDVLAESASIRRVIVSGHTVGRPGYLQMLADVLAVPVEACALPSTAALGAALGARSLAGLADAAPVRRAVTATATPGASTAAYQQLYVDYLSSTA